MRGGLDPPFLADIICEQPLVTFRVVDNSTLSYVLHVLVQILTLEGAFSKLFLYNRAKEIKSRL